VDESGKPIGIITRSDLLFEQQQMHADAGELSPSPPTGRAADFRAAGLRTVQLGALVGDVMTERVVTLPETATVAQAAALMATYNLHGIPVVSAAGAVVGMLSANDIVAWVAGMFPVEDQPETSREFADREQAGRRLGEQLLHHAGQDPVVLGLSRGGVAVASKVAEMLDAPLDAWLVHKGCAPPEVRGRTVILVDDAIATGGTARTALEAMRSRGAQRLVLAVPVAELSVIAGLRPLADEVVCLAHPRKLIAVGFWYDDFRPVFEAEVIRLVERGRQRWGRPGTAAGRSGAGGGDS
jgi:predicted phosphoribosyltransferase